MTRSLRASVVYPSVLSACSLLYKLSRYAGPPIVARTMTTLSRNEEVRHVKLDGKEFNVVREGAADILSELNEEAAKGDSSGSSQSVFYNPIQQFNRDLSVIAIKAFSEDILAIRKSRHERRLQNSLGKPKRAKRNKRDDVTEAAASRGTGVEKEALDESGTAASVTFANEQVRSEMQDGGKKRKSDEMASSGKSVGDHVEKKSRMEVEEELPAPGVPSGPSAEVEEQPMSDLIDPMNGLEQNDSLNGHEELSKTDNGAGNDQQSRSAGPQFRILDALSATGLRAIRYAKEISAVTLVTANDLSPSAVNSIRTNVKYNQVEAKVHPIFGNAVTHMNQIGNDEHARMPNGAKAKYEVVDLDPYGTAAPFLDSAVQAVSDGGLLCVTCTDAPVFASVGYLEKTYALYGGLPWKGTQSHEAGLRLILHAVAQSAARYGLAIEPLLSLSIDYYARVFVRIRRSPAEVKLLPGKTMVVYNCDSGCGAWTTQFLAKTHGKENRNGQVMYKFTSGQAPTANSTCEHCGYKTHLAGPMWGGPIHSPFFVQRLLDELPKLDKTIYGTIPRLEGMLTLALHETLLPPDVVTSKEAAANGQGNRPNPQASSAEQDVEEAIRPLERLDPIMRDHHPFFVMPSALAKVLHCVSPSDAALRSGFLSMGYRVARSHTKPGSIRTDAPWPVIWEVMREWVRKERPVKDGAVKEGTAGWGIWQKVKDKEDIHLLREKLIPVFGGDQAKVDAVMAMVNTMGKLPKSQSDGAPGTASEAEAEKKVIFDEALGRDTDKKKLVRYQINPRKNWGPMSKATGAGAA